MFVFDVETLDTESTTVILSAAIVFVKPEDDYQSILDRTCFVKFKVKEQIELGRTSSKDTLDWWKEQSEYAQKVSLRPDPEDVSARFGMDIIHRYIEKYDPEKKETFWARGSLDQMSIDSLCRNLNMEVIAPYWAWRDVRTAVDCLTGSTNGYCNVKHPTFNRDLVIKHHPAHDVALDAMMLMYGVAS